MSATGNAGGVRTILHADMDAFYAAVEQRDHPDSRGKPVIVGGLGRRGVVSTASYEARRFGVHSAQPTAVARRLCPDGIYVRGRMQVYAFESRRIRALFEELTPLVEPLSLDEAFLDVTDSRALFGTGEEIARRLRAAVFETTGLRVSVGVAASKFVAKVASDLRKPDALVVVPPGTEAAFLAPLPVARLWGAGRRTQERFTEAGLFTIGDLQGRSLEQLVRLVGTSAGEHYHRLCQGLDSRPVQTERAATSVSHETTFETDVADPEHLARVMLRLAEGVGRRCRHAGLAGRTVRLKIRFPPFETHTRQRKLDEPTWDDVEIYQQGLQLMAAARGDRAVRLLGLGLTDLVDHGAPSQRDLFGADEERRRDQVLATLDAIRQRFGDDAARHGGR